MGSIVLLISLYDSDLKLYKDLFQSSRLVLELCTLGVLSSARTRNNISIMMCYNSLYVFNSCDPPTIQKHTGRLIGFNSHTVESELYSMIV